MGYLIAALWVGCALLALRFWMGMVEQHRQVTFAKLRFEREKAEREKAAAAAAESRDAESTLAGQARKAA
ncbi:hypothetical protein [Planctopirus hydrillae]|uniref:Uncharacterized protein n=1 Tax=Planctopirus hydrillae TaxID=1841610 RepID=A0A1C3EH54_9PLAN|nr:hypothetical protein [Planctopirus hydrillae]ODA32539.1 hypothetical protein A6X21_19420 [Planctopirus hydrillae]